jgi:hypothetical protein
MSNDPVPRLRAGRIRSTFDWAFRNPETGKVTLAQFPNLSLAIFLVASLVRRFAHLTDTPHVLLDVVVAASLTWCESPQ